MRADQGNEGLRWLRQAQQDLDDARYSRDGGRHNLACFLAQQAAEKALKGYLYGQGVEAPWGHSAYDLAEAAEDFDQAFGALRKKARDLDKYYIPTRYPNGLPGGLPSEAFDSRDSDTALTDADQIIGLVAERLTGDAAGPT